jgi:hypothetical protein
VKVLCCLFVAIWSSACANRLARADQFWTTWEGETYPEDDGWTHYTRAGGAQRSLADDAMILDGMSSSQIVDEYYISRPLVPSVGELFRLDWRLRVDEEVGFTDPGMFVDAQQTGEVMFGYREDAIYSTLEGVWIEIAPGVFHQYSLQSSDMLSYYLYIDGELARVGSFSPPTPLSGVCWGDVTEGARSRSTWDYVRFGIVPEPATGLACGLVWLAAIGLRARRTRRIAHETRIV